MYYKMMHTSVAILLLYLPTFLTSPCTFDLLLLHNNDVHSNFQEFKGEGSLCKPEDSMERKCFGGMPRLVTKLREIRRVEPDSIFLNAGDYFQGTIYYTMLKYKPVLAFTNLLNYTAMSLGNHEFDDAVAGLVPFVDGANFPILAANLDLRNETRLNGKIKKSIIVNIKGVKVGIIGYLTEDTVDISRVDSTVTFLDLIRSVGDEAKRLKQDESIEHLIAVGHAGYSMDKELCKKVPELDIVVGGHSDTFLYSGTPPSGPAVQGKYPTVIEGRPRLSPCLVVQDYAKGKYLGYLKVKFDSIGNVKSYSGNPILLDYTIPKDKDTFNLLKKYQIQVTRATEAIIGESKIFLNGDRSTCRFKECSIGDLVTDAIADYFKSLPSNNDKPIYAIYNAGAVRASIDIGKITFGQIFDVLPFDGSVELAALKGSTLKKAFLNSISGYDVTLKEGRGRFLQVSGFKVAYQVFNSSNIRLLQLCAINKAGIYEPVRDDQVYNVAAPEFLLSGKDGYSSLLEGIRNSFNAKKDNELVKDYISKVSPIVNIDGGRINVITGDKPLPSGC